MEIMILLVANGLLQYLDSFQLTSIARKNKYSSRYAQPRKIGALHVRMNIYKGMRDRILDRIIRFDILLGITALTIALVAAFFSVYGISTLFAGAFLATAIMASSLEVGKLVAVTFLYRYWGKTKGYLRTYLSIATIVLMLITSLGIFGYLSSAYQKSSLEYKAGQEKIAMIESQKPFYSNMIAQSEARIKMLSGARVTQEARLSDAMTNAFLSRNPLQLKQLQEQTINLISQANEDIKSESGQVRTNQAKIMSINDEVITMKFEGAGKKDIRTFQFVAEQFGTTLDKVAKWFIFTLIFVFDPLAVALILAYNIAVFKKVEEKTINPQPEPPLPIMQSTNSKSEEKAELVDSPIELTNGNNSEKLPLVNPPVEPILSSSISPEPVPKPPPSVPSDGLDPFYRRMFKL
jgi:hypothetical protein